MSTLDPQFLGSAGGLRARSPATDGTPYETPSGRTAGKSEAYYEVGTGCEGAYEATYAAAYTAGTYATAATYAAGGYNMLAGAPGFYTLGTEATGAALASSFYALGTADNTATSSDWTSDYAGHLAANPTYAASSAYCIPVPAGADEGHYAAYCVPGTATEDITFYAIQTESPSAPSGPVYAVASPGHGDGGPHDGLSGSNPVYSLGSDGVDGASSLYTIANSEL